MNQSTNNIIIAPAGSGKTTLIVNDALKKAECKILITTYTLNNVQEIKKKFYQSHGHIPLNITIMPWFTFLLYDFVRPYQNFLYKDSRIESVFFVNKKSTNYVSKGNISKYYMNSKKYIYTDKISEFGYLCNERSSGLVIQRLENIYEHIYIDEVQDLAGYDLELIETLFRSKININLVGDHRQATFQTNNSNKNKQFSGSKIIDKFTIWEKKGLCTIKYLQDCLRCIQTICNFADKIYPEFPKTHSKNNELTDHDGIFIIKSKDVGQYIKQYSPQILRYDKKTTCISNQVLNFGISKGLTFKRVLIYPHGPLSELIKTGEFSHVINKAKIYVALTRAKNSLAFVYDGEYKLEATTYSIGANTHLDLSEINIENIT